MAAKSVKKKSVKGKKRSSNSRLKKNTGPKSALIGFIIAAFCLLLVFEAVKLFNAPEVEKDIMVQVVGQFSGSDQSCGKFGAWDVAALGNDKVAVCDQESGRVLLFNRSGKFIKSWGKKGEGPDDLSEPSGITSDDKGNVYFVDAWKAFIIGLDSTFKPNLKVSLSPGFYGPRGVAFDGTYFYVADTGTHRVAKVSLKGQVVSSWGGNKQGSGKNEFNNPRSLKVDPKGNLYVADFENDRVQVLDSNGKFVRQIKVGNKVTDVALDSTGRLFASSMDGNFVKVYTLDGKSLGQLKSTQGPGGLFRSISGINFTPDGILLLASGDTISMIRVP